MALFEYEFGPSIERPGSLGVKSAAGVICIFFLWLVFSGAAVKYIFRQVTPFQFVDTAFGLKFALYEQYGFADEVFIGSSRIYRHLNPAVLGEQCEKTYLNLGIGGADSGNIKFLLQWLLSRPTPPGRIWIEPRGADAARNIETERALLFSPFWPQQIWWDRFGPVLSKSQGSAVEAVWYLVKKSASSYFLVGAYWELDEGWVSSIGLDRLYYTFAQGGFVPLEQSERSPGIRSRSAELQRLLQQNPDFLVQRVEEHERYYSRMERRAVEMEIVADVAPIFDGLSKSQLSRLGIIYSPSERGAEIAGLDSVHIDGISIPVATFPTQHYPELALSSLWYDRGHLNRQGADVLSRIFASKWCDS